MKSEKLYASSFFASSEGDPVADIVGLLRPVTTVHPVLRASGPWAVRFAAYPYVKVGGVDRGDCWLTLDGHEPVPLHEGDFYMLVNPPAHRLGGDLTTTPRDGDAVWDTAVDGVARIGPDADDLAQLCGGSFRFDASNGPLLVDVVPTVVRIPASDPRVAEIAGVTALLNAEIRRCAAGRSLLLDHLVQILFVLVLRAHADQADRPAGWLGALSGDGVGAALRAMHADVARRWTLQDLAGVGRMSRSSFAAAFKRQTGTAPLDYLIQWRMSLARDALRRDTRTISELAYAVGYESESAFGTAFRRVNGVSPRQFRDKARRLAASG